MKYEFKKIAEVGWFVAVAVVIYLADAVREQDFNLITDWGMWFVILMGGAARVALAAVATWITTNVLKSST